MDTMENDNLTESLREILAGSTAFIGVGNTDRIDDGAGIALARMLSDGGLPHVFEGGTTPERVLHSVTDGDFDTVIFLDAIDAGVQPGSIVMMNSRDIAARYPQVSTHKISLGTLAGIVGNDHGREAYLLGIQPQSVAFKPGAGLSAAIDTTVKLLATRIMEARRLPHSLKRRQVHAV